MSFSEILNFLTSSQFGIWGWPTIIIILGTGIYLTFKLKFLQVRKFPHTINSTLISSAKSVKVKNNKKSVSAFEAFSTAISGSIGTGNIIGVTNAILTGGPGAIFWMWISAFFGMVTNYTETVLSVYYRKKNSKGEYVGGPAYYITNGLKLKWLAYIACVFCLIASVGMSAVQTNKISSTIVGSIGNDEVWLKLLIGTIVAVLIALIILGGVKRIGKVSSFLVPFMTIAFFILAIIIICSNYQSLPFAIKSIFKYAFNFKSAGGGILGYATSQIIQKGMSRGIFSNEAGLGSSSIAHASTNETEPVKQGLWGILAVFIDTFVVCTLTSLIILSSFDLTTLSSTSIDTAVAISAFSNTFGSFGKVAFSIILPVFAFTTILAWAFYGEKSIEFIFEKFGSKAQQIATIIFKTLFVVLIVLWAIVESDIVWNLSDVSNVLMCLPNLIALIFLSNVVVKITKNYFARKKGENLEPMISAYKENLQNETQEDNIE
ncbi:MAG: alanine:cation symporter family protein [Clostridia bacterium]|nr:alanine:cation symporter family protein [Clostridia bacterium]